MNLDLHLPLARLSRADRWFLIGAWLVIVAKCVFVHWAFGHWNVPFNAWWIVSPTLIFAGVATQLWLSHKD